VRTEFVPRKDSVRPLCLRIRQHCRLRQTGIRNARIDGQVTDKTTSLRATAESVPASTVKSAGNTNLLGTWLTIQMSMTHSRAGSAGCSIFTFPSSGTTGVALFATVFFISRALIIEADEASVIV